jgi:hypothetical protein
MAQISSAKTNNCDQQRGGPAPDFFAQFVMHPLDEKANMPMRETGHTTSCAVYKLSRKVQNISTLMFSICNFQKFI